MNPAVIKLIESRISPLISSGKSFKNIHLMVCPHSDIAKYPFIFTRYGSLIVRPGENIPKGYAYVIEKPLTRGGVGFAWVSKPP